MNKKSQDLYKKGKKRIPGGTQLLSKRPEMFLPDNWPNYYSKAKGAEVWDLEGNKYVDMSYNGIGSCILGFADSDVDNAVKKAIDKGSMATLNCFEEVELADLLCDLHKWADMVRFSRTGGEAMAIAVRIARAKSGKDKLAFCGYHGWHDWYLSANLNEDKALDGHLIPGLEPKGVPRGLRGTALPFNYNKLDELEKIFRENKGEIGTIVMEPIRNKKPEKGFMEGVRKIADKNNVILVFDEVSAGWRINNGGYHLNFNIEPDMAVFAKAMSNGYPMSAVIGRRGIMEAAQTTFISSTYWTERVGATAAIATIKKYKKHNIGNFLNRAGENVIAGWTVAAKKTGLKIHTEDALPPMAHFGFEYENKRAMQTLFTQLMLERGYLANGAYYATYAHKDQIIRKYLNMVEEVFGIIAKALKEEKVEKMLKGPIAHDGFKRLN